MRGVVSRLARAGRALGRRLWDLVLAVARGLRRRGQAAAHLAAAAGPRVRHATLRVVAAVSAGLRSAVRALGHGAAVVRRGGQWALAAAASAVARAEAALARLAAHCAAAIALWAAALGRLAARGAAAIAAAARAAVPVAAAGVMRMGHLVVAGARAAARFVGRAGTRTARAAVRWGRLVARLSALAGSRTARAVVWCGRLVATLSVSAGAFVADVAVRCARAGAFVADAVVRWACAGARRAGVVASRGAARAGRARRFITRIAAPVAVAARGAARTIGRRAPVRGRRPWLLLGVPVAAVAGLSTIASISLLPPSMHTKSIAFAVASSEMSVQTPTSSGNTPDLSHLYPLPEWAAVMADEMTSPKLKTLIAQQARIPVSQLAIDGPISLDLQRTQQEPTQEKRSYQLLAEGDPYRVTLDTDPNVAGVTITAQAPSESAARGLVLAVDRAAADYLTGVEEAAGTPPADRVEVAQFQPVVITGGSGGHTVAALVFVVVYVLWCGLIFLCDKLIRDVRALRRLGPLLPSQVPASALRSSIESKYGYGPVNGRRGH